jgi:uncharacterized membrane protein YbhN (UPF0104 family)
VKQDSAAQVAKWAAVSTLVLTVLFLVLGFVGERGEPERDEPSALLFLFLGVGFLALVSAAISIMTCVASRLERRPGRPDEHRT